MTATLAGLSLLVAAVVAAFAAFLLLTRLQHRVGRIGPLLITAGAVCVFLAAGFAYFDYQKRQAAFERLRLFEAKATALNAQVLSAGSNLACLEATLDATL